MKLLTTDLLQTLYSQHSVFTYQLHLHSSLFHHTQSTFIYHSAGPHDIIP